MPESRDLLLLLQGCANEAWLKLFVRHRFDHEAPAVGVKVVEQNIRGKARYLEGTGVPVEFSMKQIR